MLSSLAAGPPDGALPAKFCFCGRAYYQTDFLRGAAIYAGRRELHIINEPNDEIPVAVAGARTTRL